MEKKVTCFSILLCCCMFCPAQQVVSTGGYSVKSEYSINWILGGSLTNIFYEPETTAKIQSEKKAESVIPFKVYPIPAGDYLKIELASADTARLILELYDSRGIKVLSQSRAFQPVIELSLTDILPGTYLLRIICPSKESALFETKKIIKN